MLISRTLLLSLTTIACSKDARPPATVAPAPASQPPEHHAASSTMLDPGAPEPQPATEAVAVLVPTKGNTVRGTVRFRQGDGGRIDVTTSIEGLPTGGAGHAYHVHVYGDCSHEAAESAGPHFHFHGSSLDKTVKIITGNLGDLQATSPTTTHRTTIEASMHGPFSIVGRAVVVHAKPNDPSKPPDGGAGPRLACGVIGVAKAAGETAAPTAAHHH